MGVLKGWITHRAIVAEVLPRQPFDVMCFSPYINNTEVCAPIPIVCSNLDDLWYIYHKPPFLEVRPSMNKQSGCKKERLENAHRYCISWALGSMNRVSSNEQISNRDRSTSWFVVDSRHWRCKICWYHRRVSRKSSNIACWILRWFRTWSRPGHGVGKSRGCLIG